MFSFELNYNHPLCFGVFPNYTASSSERQIPMPNSAISLKSAVIKSAKYLCCILIGGVNLEKLI